MTGLKKTEENLLYENSGGNVAGERRKMWPDNRTSDGCYLADFHGLDHHVCHFFRQETLGI